ncbi:hypothetical protein C0Q70_14281 [Pomacea canaliculata]|uniref:Uncharacterized protein n=1 Tax=Pomacea canaliculata TaxID=400727 RepID=A0A2T7NZJ7_POMCA|nr:hypothetical protein C0Q70_14281 [Pomacea canaliculata]
MDGLLVGGQAATVVSQFTMLGKFTGELSGAQHEQFLTSKQYASLECTLTVPSTQLFHVTDLEKTFTDNMERILYMDKVVRRRTYKKVTWKISLGQSAGSAAVANAALQAP